ncbi:hypothetical protein KF707_09760 [Candidatus Obscuribacterales bacterium]|nr:hypothetical protein [Candidatus Obscuribacterales bacterium]MBX3136511.1 hypothetical protein [Candidatus Obscuribacterales bacterium]MBX3151249.1 hypothetical protein [Candidatus Obscuribacterales bacterium]
MAKQERREKMSLDLAYEVYCNTIKAGGSVELHAIAEAIKTVKSAMHASSSGAVRLTDRLWYRIQQALFDKILTNYSSRIEVLTYQQEPLSAGEEIPQTGLVRIYPEGLRRLDDWFELPVMDLHDMTVKKVSKVRAQHGDRLSHEYFIDLHIECAGACMMPPDIVFGHERLRDEARQGREIAFSEWWDLYWRAYCTPDPEELTTVRERMAMLESVWGDLSIVAAGVA